MERPDKTTGASFSFLTRQTKCMKTLSGHNASAIRNSVNIIIFNHSDGPPAEVRILQYSISARHAELHKVMSHQLNSQFPNSIWASHTMRSYFCRCGAIVSQIILYLLVKTYTKRRTFGSEPFCQKSCFFWSGTFGHKPTCSKCRLLSLNVFGQRIYLSGKWCAHRISMTHMCSEKCT